MTDNTFIYRASSKFTERLFQSSCLHIDAADASPIWRPYTGVYRHTVNFGGFWFSAPKAYNSCQPISAIFFK